MMRIEIDEEPICHGSGLCFELEEAIKKNKSEIEGGLIGDLRHINHRAECHTGIEVEEVQHLNDNEYMLGYSYVWTVYNGCKDMNEQDEEIESISFTVEDDGEIIFNFLEIEGRTTHNEF